MARTIHGHINKRVALAKIYAKDGAIRTAASIFRDLADELSAHMDQCDAELRDALDDADPINLAGSGPVPVEPREG